MACYSVTVDGFKAQFPALPYLPLYIYGKAYFKGDIVYVAPNFYQSLVDGNLADVSDTTKWALYPDNEDNYVTDNLISEAFGEAQVNFNPELFPDCNTLVRVFYYLAAHYLVVDVNNASNPFSLGFIGFTQSKSVGSVSASFGVPQWMLNDPLLSGYAQTGFGRKYLSLIAPYLVGNVMLLKGKTTYNDGFI